MSEPLATIVMKSDGAVSIDGEEHDLEAGSSVSVDPDGTVRIDDVVAKTPAPAASAAKAPTIAVTGDVDSVTSKGDVRIQGDAGRIDAGGDVACEDVTGPVSAGGDVACADVRGAITAQGDVRAEDVSGPITAGGDVTHG